MHLKGRMSFAQMLLSESLSLRERVAAAGSGFGRSEALRSTRILTPNRSPEGSLEKPSMTSFPRGAFQQRSVARGND